MNVTKLIYASEHMYVSIGYFIKSDTTLISFNRKVFSLVLQIYAIS